MATKYQIITSLYESTIKQATNNTSAWTDFLRSACRNYKCRFDEQILIYAQRPNATAVLEIEKWNKQFGRWVNKGATGIAVFDDAHNGNYRLKHYFDIADTHESQLSRPVPIWQLEQRFEAEVIESLENSFGYLEGKSTFADALVYAAKNAVDDNLTDYLNDLMYIRNDSFLEELDEQNVEVEYRTVLQNSVAYMMLTRCGIAADKYFELEDFQYLVDFNTPQTVNAIGLATSDIAESCLREISATVINLQRAELNHNRTFAMPEKIEDNIIINNTERSAEHGTNISDGGRLSHTEPDLAGGISLNPWQVRIAPKEIPETAPQDIVREFADIGQAERTFDGNRTDSERANGADNRTDGGTAGRDGAAESIRPDEVGGNDEQHSTISGGNDTGRPDIQLKPLPTVAEQLNIFGKAEEIQSSAFSISQQIIDEVLTSGGNELDSTMRIVSYFKKDHTTAENADFLQKEYHTGGKGFIFSGNHVSVWFNDSGIRIATGDTAINAEHSTLVTWEQAAKRIRELLDLGRNMPQSELDKADGVEIKALADSLWYTHQDRMEGYEFSFLPQELFKGGFPNSTAQIAELIAQPEQRQQILDGLREFAADYEQNPELLRFRFSADHMRTALNGLSDLEREPLVFTADEAVSSGRAGFITQDEVDSVLAGGSGIQDGHYRIYSYFLQDHTAKEKADFLKDEYGTGGSGRTGFNEWHDSKGIAYSRENNHMPYDKVILPWPRVAKRIDELITNGRYMSEAQLAHLPEYEKDVLAGEVYSFYPFQGEEISRPYPYGADHSDGKKAIRPQLDDPARVAEILQGMAEILDNTADFDRNYERMRQAFDDLTAYQNGTYSLFTPDKATEEKQAQRTSQTHLATPATSTQLAAEYALELGSTVYLGTEEFEIYSFDDAHVVLRDVTAPLFTKDIPRDEFDRKLRENRLNDGLIKAETEQEPMSIIDKFYVDKDSGKITWVYFNPDSDAGGQYVFNEVYFDLIAETAEISSTQDEFFDRIGSMAKQTIVDIGTDGFADADRNFKSDPYDFSGCDVATMNALTALAHEAQNPQKLIGERYEIDGRKFVVDSVNTALETVSLRDITFEDNTGFPIFRSESLEFIQMHSLVQPEPQQTATSTKPESIIPSWEKAKTHSRTQTFDAFPGVPMSERHNFIITDDDLGTGGAKTKYRNNVEAIRTLQTIESENRLATPEEQEILSRYVGWGGLADAFDENKPTWTNEYIQLKSLLSTEEYTSARATTLNAHYTSPTVIKAIYKAVENMGFKTG